MFTFASPNIFFATFAANSLSFFEFIVGGYLLVKWNSILASAPFALAIPEAISFIFFSKKDLVSGLKVLIVPPNFTLSSITL